MFLFLQYGVEHAHIFLARLFVHSVDPCHPWCPCAVSSPLSLLTVSRILAVVYSVPSQTYNERGVEGLPQSMSRLNTAWYMQGNSGAGNQLKPGESTYILRALPDHQQTAALAKKTAELWIGNPANKMMLPEMMRAADASGDGLIDIDEARRLSALSSNSMLHGSSVRSFVFARQFKVLMEKAGAVGDINKLFAEIDDGDGQLTISEVRKLADRNRTKFKAAN